MELNENERLDEVNDNIKLIQYTDGLTFGSDALLLAGYIKGRFSRALEIGGGTGIISMLVATREKAASIDCIEIQEDFSRLIERNVTLNGLNGRIRVINADVRDLSAEGRYDLVFTNPPYMKTDSGKANLSDRKNIARHEVAGTVKDICRAAAGLLKFGGSFYAVYRPDRLADLICAMRECGIEPKRMTFVHGSAISIPSMVLVEGKRGGKPGVRLTRPLILCPDTTVTEYGADGNYIMDNGRFPDDFN